MLPRILASTILKSLATFPAVVVTGPRQSGKTTLLQSLLQGSHSYVSLENPDVRIRAKEDPVGFLAAYTNPVIIDEIQYVPELLSYIKTRIDEKRTPGQWVLTGSQLFPLMAGVSQSLAGRAAILTLFPFSYAEAQGSADHVRDISTWLQQHKEPRPSVLPDAAYVMLRGFYPELVSNAAVDRELWCSSYIATYVERDVRAMARLGDLSQFERFVKLCAIRTGQQLHASEMARDIGVSMPTVKRWLSLLEAAGQVILLQPYYRNLGKRLMKSPKLYFTDTALASYLMGIHDVTALNNSPHYGALFETMIVMDVVKRFLHLGRPPQLYYIRTRDGLEIDLVVEHQERLHCFEIKSTATITPVHAQALLRIQRSVKEVASCAIISASSDSFPVVGSVQNISWYDALRY